MSEVRTHVSDAAGARCVVCGCELPPVLDQGQRVRARVGQRVGLISGTTFTGPSAYFVSARDSNAPCKTRRRPRPLMEGAAA